MNDKADFTQGSILKKLIAFMIPVLGSLILQAAYGDVYKRQDYTMYFV